MNITTNGAGIASVILQTPDPQAAAAFTDAAFGLGDRLRVRASDAPTSGFRGFTLSLVVAGPSTVDGFVESAIAAGATTLKPVKKSFWGYGGVVQAPDGTIWKVATSQKKDSGTATRTVDDVVVLLGVQDVKATKQFYLDHGMTVARGFGSKYVEFDAPKSAIKMALYNRRAAAKDAGVDPEGSGSHRVVFGGGLGTFTDPDGFEWETLAD